MSRFSRKARALAAGGAVLGLGAAVTLAAWSDSEFAQGTFASGQFGIQGSADGTAYGDHTAEGEALTLSFDETDIDLEGMQPGQTATADYWIRAIEGAEPTVVTYTGASGETAAYTTAITRDGDGPLLAEGTFALESGEVQKLTIAVTLDAEHDPAVATDANIVWQFDAAAVEPTVDE